MRRAPAAVLAAVALAAAAGCGGGGSEREAKAPDPTATPVPTISSDTSSKPVVPKPAGSPPAKLVVKDIVEGKGKKAKPGDTVSVDYVGVNYADAKQFDASWDRGQPIQFKLGSGQVIPGWDKGLDGMRVGGRRELVIPPALAYGPAGQPPVIGPNETLIFVVDLKDLS